MNYYVVVKFNSSDEDSGRVMAMAIHRRSKSFRYLFRHHQRNNKSVFWYILWYASSPKPLHISICAGFGSLPTAKYPQNLWHVISFQMPCLEMTAIWWTLGETLKWAPKEKVVKAKLSGKRTRDRYISYISNTLSITSFRSYLIPFVSPITKYLYRKRHF